MIDVNKLKAFEYDVVGAIYAVHGELGAGLHEACYQEGLQIELTERGIPFVRKCLFIQLIVVRLWNQSLDWIFYAKMISLLNARLFQN